MNRNVKILTFSGVDGAGKTTILREFVKILRSQYHLDVVELRHRPSILPILSSIKHGKEQAELKTMEVLPRTGSNRSKISSLLRYYYYLADYIVGQWVVYFRYTRKNKVVVYDRYYFDFIVDPKRTNINLDKKFTGFFYRFIFKPDINIFLYADPDVILNRKKEMDVESIKTLTAEYRFLFDELSRSSPNRYISIENTDINKTLEQISSAYLKLFP